MKKQIFILALFVLAAFASVTNSYGQTALAPSPGVAYDYAATIVGTTGATGKTYQFFITKNTDLVAGALAPEAAGVDFLVNVAGATYNDPANIVNHINLTWTIASAASVTPFYLVVKYTETVNACAVVNEKVWQIKPINSFYLTFVPSNVTGGTVLPADAIQCVADISAANITKVDADPTKSEVTYVYGENKLYYKITAAGMLGTWRPDISLPVLGGLGQNYKSVEWNDKADGTGAWHPFVGAATTTAAGTYSSADTDLATITDAVAGTSYLVRIVIDNKNFETLADQPILVGVDGFLPPFPSITSDVVSATILTPEAAFGKTATNTISKRPTETGTPAFITKVP